MLNPFPENISHIAIIAPAGPPKEAYVKKTCKFFEGFGIKTTIMPYALKGTTESYYSASVQERVSDIHAAWQDESIDLLLCARGGSGCAQLLPFIDWELIKSRKLPLIGYSDITVLHLAMSSEKAGIPVSGPMARDIQDLTEDEYTASSLRKVLSGEKQELSSLSTVKKGEAKAPALPVNLAVLCSLIGTPYFPDLTDKTLIIEDISEEPYKLERMLTQLQLSGSLEKLSGLIYGDFKDCGTEKELNHIFEKYSSFVNGPVLSGLPFGHSLPMTCFEVGKEMTIEKNSSITF